MDGKTGKRMNEWLPWSQLDEFPQATDKVSERRQKGGRKQTEKNRQTTDTTEMEEEEGKRGKEGTVRERERKSEPVRASQSQPERHPHPSIHLSVPPPCAHGSPSCLVL